MLYICSVNVLGPSPSTLFFQCFFNLSGQSCKNIIIGRRIIICTLFLMHQRYVDERHQRYDMITLAPLICLCIGIVALGDELSG